MNAGASPHPDDRFSKQPAVKQISCNLAESDSVRPGVGRSCFCPPLSSAALPASAGNGYLTAVGPEPLRFELPANPARPFPRASRPPTPVAAPATNDSIQQVPATPPAATLPTVIPQIPPAATTNEVDATSGAKPDEVVLPQMLLKYFERSTNGTGTGIIAPMVLPPTRPPVPPSSSATYSN